VHLAHAKERRAEARRSASSTRRTAPSVGQEAGGAAVGFSKPGALTLKGVVSARPALEMTTFLRFLRYPYRVSQLRKLIRARRRRQVSELFARRAERFQAECGWCGKTIGEDEPVVAVGGRVHDGIDLSLVEGKVVELAFEVAKKTILAGVAGFDSPAKAEGKDIVFMACSDDCGHRLQAAFADELARGLDIR
jgi:hypothetical protein